MVYSDGDLYEYIFENDSSGDYYYDDAPIDEKRDNNIDDNNEFLRLFQKQETNDNEVKSHKDSQELK